MANQHSIPLEKRLAIIRDWDATRGMLPKVTKKELAAKYGISRDTAINIINEREKYEARAAYEKGLPIGESPVRREQIFDVAPSKNNTPNPTSAQGETVNHSIQTGPPRGIDIMMIGDMQVKPGIDLGYCERIGRYCADEKPDVIVNIGDFADMPSLSSYEKPGSAKYAAQNYKDDIWATHLGMKLMMTPIREEMARSGWNPRLVMCLGNHENRILRALEETPKLDGTIGLPDLEYERWGYEVHPFLHQVIIGGVAFSHFFPSGPMGKPIGTAKQMLNKLHMSCACGHIQGRDIAFGKRGDGKHITVLRNGSSYEHDEDYMNKQSNNVWRGIYAMNDCIDGEFEEKAISMKYLRRRYGV